MRAVIYRRIRPGAFLRSGFATYEDSLNEVCSRFLAALHSAGVHGRRCDDRDLYQWLFPWFNPRPALPEGVRPLDVAPWSTRKRPLPFSIDLAEQMVLGTPQSRDGAWWFDGLPHRCLSVHGLRTRTRPGQLTGERRQGEHINTVFDLMPEHTILAMTIIIRPQDQVANHIARVKAASGWTPPRPRSRWSSARSPNARWPRATSCTRSTWRSTCAGTTPTTCGAR
jgi:hypothetical protein